MGLNVIIGFQYLVNAVLVGTLSFMYFEEYQNYRETRTKREKNRAEYEGNKSLLKSHPGYCYDTGTEILLKPPHQWPKGGI